MPFISHAQNFNYENAWKNIEKNTKAGQFKSLRKDILSIYDHAKNDNNTQQKVKSILYISQIDWTIGEDDVSENKDNVYKTFNYFKDEIKNANSIEKAILQNYLALMYQQYANSTNYAKGDVQQLEHKNPKDFKTWTLSDFKEESDSLFEVSLANKQQLYNQKAKDYNILLENKDKNDLSPTLYDILSYNYYNYLNVTWNLPNTLKTKYSKKADSVLNNLIQIHSEENDKSLYLYYSLIKIQKENKDSEDKIKKLISQYPNQTYTSELYFALASSQLNKGNKLEAHTIIVEALSKTTKGIYQNNLINLKNEIEKKSISISINSLINPNNNIPVKISHTNINEFNILIFDVTPTYDDIQNKKIKFEDNTVYSEREKLIKTIKVQLNKFEDYAIHSTIYKLDGLPEGTYKITTNFEEDQEESSIVRVGKKTVTETSVNNKKYFQLIDANSGELTINTKVKIYSDTTIIKKYSFTPSTTETYEIDQNGNLILDYYRNNDYILNIGKEFIKLPNSYDYDNYSSSDNNPISYTAKIFTDRSIYRPGQKIYFKAIAIKSDTFVNSVVANRALTIRLEDVNRKEVQKLTLTTNEYGSVFGEFILPNSGLTGYYNLHIEDKESDIDNDLSVRVEEYKRPKFEIIFDSLKNAYTLDKKVEISGKSISYAGAPISDAKVSYSITKREIYVWRRFGWSDDYPHSIPNETIANGDTITNDEGKFTIPFIAKTNGENTTKTKRSYIYTVHIDITDQNGETHSQTQSVTIGDLPYKINLSVPATINTKDWHSLNITSMNLNGLRYNTQGTIKITQLKQPERIILPHYSSAVSYQLYNYEQFVNYFPHLSYGKEDENPSNYKKENIVYSKNFNTNESDSISIDKQLPRGYYLVEANSIYQNDTITDFAIVQLTDENNKSADNTYFTTKLDKESYKIGDIAKISIQTDIKEKSVVQFLLGTPENTPSKSLEFQNGNIEIKHTITKEDVLKGLFFKTAFIKWNDYASVQTMIPIQLNELAPLKIETETFRDKIEPGKQEKWTIHISGKEKDKLTAEVLASMYDASLDQFASNNFDYSIYQNYPILNNGFYNRWGIRFFDGLDNLNTKSNFSLETDYDRIDKTPNYFISNFDWYGFQASEYNRNRILYRSLEGRVAGVALQNTPISSKGELNEVVVTGFGTQKKKSITGAVASVKADAIAEKSEEKVAESYGIPRTNLQETAFFYPNLLTDKKGNIQLEFTSPEALTKWKLLLFAHTKAMQTGSNTFYTQTQKDLMVVPNLPRFLREKDKISISTKINNLSDKNLAGTAQLILTDAFTGEVLDTIFSNTYNAQNFTIGARKNVIVNWNISIPQNHAAVNVRIQAKAGNYSDGEENILPILTNRTLVTETQAISVRENQTRSWSIPNFSMDTTNATKQNFSYTVEMVTNPIWSAVFSLPYLREYPYECAEQLFSRYYGSVLSNYIITKNPAIKRVFDEWNSKGLLKSNLEKNKEVKNILLEETPWLLDGQNETEQMRRISLLFDVNKMSSEIAQAFDKLKNRQKPSGGFAWFGDGPESEYITEYILQGFGKLKSLLGTDYEKYASKDLNSMIAKAINYVDNYQDIQIKEEQKRKIKYPAQFMHFYYICSFWMKEYPLTKTAKSFLNTTLKSLSKDGLKFDLQRKALAAIVLKRYGSEKEGKILIQNLKETSVDSDEQGMFWKNNIAGWYWYQTPIENQTATIEAFAEVTPNDTASIESMKVWLLKNKQNNNWPTTKSTTEAIYALMKYGKSWQNSEKGVTIKLGNQEVYPNTNQQNTTGYFKQVWNAADIHSNMSKIEVKKTTPGVAYGGVYYQYFEDLDKVKSSGYDIKMEKKLYIKKNTATGIQLIEISPSTPIKIGDLVTVRLVIKTDRDMEYIHLKDMRASGFEPVNVLSQYKWQNGAGYYESTRDAATNFFFDYLPKGTYTFDYDVRANNAGTFSNGITTLQNMYAPEMSAHSEGIHVSIQ